MLRDGATSFKFTPSRKLSGEQKVTDLVIDKIHIIQVIGAI